MIVTMITGIQGYSLTSAEIQTVIDVVQEKFAPEINYIDVRNMNMDCGAGAPNNVLDISVKGEQYEYVFASCGPMAQYQDLADALVILKAGFDSPMCPRALKTIKTMTELSEIAARDLEGATDFIAVPFPEQGIYWMLRAIKHMNAGVALFALQESHSVRVIHNPPSQESRITNLVDQIKKQARPNL